MSARAELLFRQLQSREALEALIETPENADFDCKQWYGTGGASKGSIAKATCGFANATGGVIVVGMKADGRRNEPDLVKAITPVDDVEAVSSAALSMILNQVEPGIEGIQVQTVSLSSADKSGVVLIYVPESDGPPRRSRVDGQFYVRIASGTVPMEYFQIEDRFGRRPHARLQASVSEGGMRANQNGQLLERVFPLIVTNYGRGLARFPALRCQRLVELRPSDSHSATEQCLWGFSDADPEWFSFRGGANHVLYPGESLRVATVTQMGIRTRAPAGMQIPVARFCDWEFSTLNMVLEVICDGSPVHRQSFAFEGVSSPATLR